MNTKQKLFYAFTGFLVGSIVLASLFYGIPYLSKNKSPNIAITHDEALRRIQSEEIKEINIYGNKATLIDNKNNQADFSIDSDTESELFFNAVSRINSEKANSIKLTSTPIEKADPLESVFRVLFILFLISPPIIVILLLVIIGKMKSKDSMK